MWKEWRMAKLKAQFLNFPARTRSEYWSPGWQLNPGAAGDLPQLTTGLYALLQNRDFSTMMITCQGIRIKLNSSVDLTNKSNPEVTNNPHPQHLCRTQNGFQLP
jgi:hypothetical protein